MKFVIYEVIDKFNMTSLHISCYGGHVYITNMLLAFGSNLNAFDMCGRTPLHYSCEEGHVGVTKVLLDHGSDICL